MKNTVRPLPPPASPSFRGTVPPPYRGDGHSRTDHPPPGEGRGRTDDPRCIHCGSRWIEQRRCLDCGRAT